MRGPQQQSQDFPHGMTHNEWLQAMDDVRHMIQ